MLFEGPILADASPGKWKKKDPELNGPRPTRGSVWRWHWPIDWKEQLPGVLISFIQFRYISLLWNMK